MLRISILLAAGLLLTMNLHAQDAPFTPPAGSAERTQILAAARSPAEAALHQSIVFVVRHLNVIGDDAFLQAVMQGEGGKAVDYSITQYAEAAEHGGQSDVYAALLHREDGAGWTVVEHVIGPTDLAWEGWDARFGVPAALLPPEARAQTQDSGP